MGWVWWLPTAAVLALMGIGAGGAYLRILEPGPGFRLFGLGIIVAATAALILSAAGALASARGSSWRGSAVRGAAVPVLITAGVLVLILTSGSHPIHDVTTDRSVGFAKEINELRPAEDYPAVLAQQAELAEQDELYRDVKPLPLEIAKADAFALALQAAKRMSGWTVTHTDPKWGRIYARAESAIFHFVDDVSISVARAPPNNSVVQMRSRSRIGQSDLGANAERIRAYFAAVSEVVREREK